MKKVILEIKITDENILSSVSITKNTTDIDSGKMLLRLSAAAINHICDGDDEDNIEGDDEDNIQNILNNLYLKL